MPEPTGPDPDVTETTKPAAVEMPAETAKRSDVSPKSDATSTSEGAAKRAVPPKAKAKAAARRRTEAARPKVKAPSSRRWVPPTFITVGLLGVAWLITYYVAGQFIPYMSDLGNWNILIGMGGMAAAFLIATLWK